MDIINCNRFIEIISEFEWTPYTQTCGWLCYNECDKTGRYICLTDDDKNPQIACFGHIKKSLGRKMLLIEGECLKSKSYKSSLIKVFYEGIRSLDFDIVEVVSNSVYNSEFEIGIRRAGFLRPVGSFSMPLSNWINLKEEIQYNSNWTRNIKKSADFHLKFELYDNAKVSDILLHTVVSFYNSFTKEKGFSHELNFERTKCLLQSPNFSLGVVTNQDNSMMSCIIFHHRKEHAGLVYAAKSEQAKENGATFFMYSSLFEALKKIGIETFDMEKLVPSTHSTDGVFLFKDGVKGNRVVYNGEWSWYRKSIYRPMMYVVKRWLFKKREL